MLNSAPLNIKLHSVPLLSIIFTPIASAVLLLIFLIQNRYEGYLPTISETGTEFPNKIFMFLIFSTISISFFYTNIINILRLKAICNIPVRSQRICHLLNFCYLFFYICISTYSINEKPSMHHFSTLASFYCSVLFNIIIIIFTFKKSSVEKKNIRIFALISENVILVIVALSERIFNWRFEGTIATIGEYYIIFANILLSSTHYSELKHAETYLSIEMN